MRIWINRVGLAAILLVSIGYILFGSSFAQQRMEFSFLNFPIFIGEILLGFCLCLFALNNFRQIQEFGLWAWVGAAYLIFILLKAFMGYVAWGPLAFRDAALFYYPMFIILGYAFFSNDLWGHGIRRLLLFLILLIFILHQFVNFWPCSLIILGIILALHAETLLERIISMALILFFAPYLEMFDIFSRTVFLASLITLVFLGVVFSLAFLPHRSLRMAGVAICLVLGMTFFKNVEKDIRKTFFIQNARPRVVMLKEPSHGKCLFHPVGTCEKSDAIKEFWHRIRKRSCGESGSAFNAKSSGSILNVKPKVEDGNYMFEIKKDDTLFRYYIWRDMAYEYLDHKPLFGFPFGRPLYSMTISKYFGAGTQWADGWVGAHNSFLYMIYRAGIVGVAMVALFLFTWSGLLRDFFILKDPTGLLLCAVLLNWMISANFFLIFELPYTAIPVWTLLGLMLKYRKFRLIPASTVHSP